MKSVYDLYDVSSNLRPIIFLHGLGDWRHSWKYVAPEIARRTKRKVYVLDARNHGDSPRSSELDYDVLTQDLVDFMDDHGIKSAVVVGHSMGGRTAINFALKHPSRTELLIVEDMTPKNINSGPESFVFQFFDTGLNLLKSVPPEMSVEDAKMHLVDIFLNILGERFIDPDRFRKVGNLDIIPIKKGKDGFEMFLNIDAILLMLQKNALVQNLPESGMQYGGDALFLYGSMPFFNLGKDSTIKKLFPKAVVKQISGSSHYIHIDNPDVFVQEVSNFILQRELPQSKC